MMMLNVQTRDGTNKRWYKQDTVPGTLNLLKVLACVYSSIPNDVPGEHHTQLPPSSQRNIAMGILLRVPQRGAWRSCECQWKARFRGGETEKIMTPMTKYRRRQSTRNRDGIVRRKEMG